MLIYKVTVNDRGGYVTEDVDVIRDDLVIMRDEGGAKNSMTIEVISMSKEELDAKPKLVPYVDSSA